MHHSLYFVYYLDCFLNVLLLCFFFFFFKVGEKHDNVAIYLGMLWNPEALTRVTILA